MKRILFGAICVVALTSTSWGAGWQKGSVQLTSGGPLAFAPDGVLLISDPMDASIYAVATGDTSGNPSAVTYDVQDIRGKLAGMLGTESADIRINDLAVNAENGLVYLSVTRGSGPAAESLIVRATPDGDLSEFSLKDVKYSKASLPNAPASRQSRRGNPRMSTITDMAFVDGRVFIAGLSNEEFASKLRSVPFPFEDADNGTSVEIYHGAHGGFETRSPVRTFASYVIGNQTNLIAAYTCTPLVKFPVSALKPGTKVVGTTIAELGNRNRPLDMFVYTKDGKDYILMANSSRGVMKVSTGDIDSIAGITSRIRGGGSAGLPYETITDLKGVVQLDRLNDASALLLVQSESGREDLRSVSLP